LRANQTSAEIALWRLLKNKQLDGRKFRRQHSVGYYILDFYCPSEKLNVEVDGHYHFTESGRKHDARRAEYLITLNIKTLRFENSEVLQNPSHVLQTIRNSIFA
jgi:very-short-patch-repair endonuclease